MKKMTYESELDDTPVGFGKYKEMTPNQIACGDPSYVIWMYDNVFYQDVCTEELRDACEDWTNGCWEEEKDLDQFYEIDGW